MTFDLGSLVALLATSMVIIPALAFGTVSIADVIGKAPSDRTLAGIAKAVFATTSMAGLAAAVLYVLAGARPVHVVFGHWFVVGDASGEHYGFDIGVLVDEVSLTYLVLTAVLAGTVGAFSLRYLGGEPGAGRFFNLLMLFASALSLLVLAESLGLLFVGWEFVGISSALLIAFYRERTGPVRNGLVVYAVYRICDVGLLAALVVLHHATGSGSFSAETAGTSATVLGLLLLFAALGKSALFPFSGWLPRAMEGPTPSSAIFYGALSVHAGAYLMLRTAPLWDSSATVRAAMVVVGALSALFGTLSGRVQTDAKSSLAYASVAQVGLIFVEIGLGLYGIAVLHVVGHATLRTLELLRAPSVLDDHLRVEAELGARAPQTGRHYDRSLPLRIRLWLYRLALERGFFDALAQRLLDRARRLALFFDRADRRYVDALDGERDGAREGLPELDPRPAPVRVKVSR